MAVSRDGTRMLMAVQTSSGPKLLVAGIIRDKDLVPTSLGPPDYLPIGTAAADRGVVGEQRPGGRAHAGRRQHRGRPPTTWAVKRKSLGSLDAGVAVVGRQRQPGHPGARFLGFGVQPERQLRLAGHRSQRLLPGLAAVAVLPGCRCRGPRSRRPMHRGDVLLRLDTVREAALDALALLLPVECAGCGVPDRAVCAELPGRPPAGAERQAAARRHPGVLGARLRRGRSGRHPGVQRAGAGRAGAGAGPGARRSGRSKPAHAVDLSGAEVVAVPGSRRARRRRGFDPVAALVARAGPRPRAGVRARSTARRAEDALDRRTGSQSRRRVRGHGGPLPAAASCSLDDVVTTGATLAAAAAALRSAGAEVVAAAVVASTPKLFGPSVAAPRERPAGFP